ncbi:putative nuclear pore complex protein [Plasmopara halstedii]
MFRSRKFVDVPSKRVGAGLLSTDTRKRQRLEQWDALYTPQVGNNVDMEESASLLMDTHCCTIIEDARLPPPLLQELLDEWPQLPLHQRYQIRCCRVPIPSARHRSGHRWVSYYVFPLRTKVLIWQQDNGKVIALQFPDEIKPNEVLYPLLFTVYSQSLSLMIVGKSGIVLFWEDITLPYKSVPLSVQIPLGANENVSSHPTTATMKIQGGEDYEDTTRLMCWSNEGNVWEIAVEDRRIRVRAFEKQSAGFFSGLTKSVSQFFFSSTTSKSEAGEDDLNVDQPILYLRVLPPSIKVTASMSDDREEREESVDMLLLFRDGMLERRAFSLENAMDCSSVSRWHMNASRVAVHYFSNNFSDACLVKVHIISMPYILETCFGLLVAFVSSPPGSTTNTTVKYVLFQFSLDVVDANVSSKFAWACLLDFEPSYDEQNSDQYFEVESFTITRDALYFAWTQMQPIQLMAIHLPQTGQTRVRSTVFPLEGVQGQTALAFEARVDPTSFDNNALKGSVSFLLIHEDAKPISGSVCMATASDMMKLEYSPVFSEASMDKTRRGREEANLHAVQSSHVLGKNLNVDDYIRLIMTHFVDDPNLALPLRVNSLDVESVAQAALAVDLQILDAKSSSGLRWGMGDSSDALLHNNAVQKETDAPSVTPKLVRYQLKEKSNRHIAFIEFLQRRCAPVWDFLAKSDDLKRHLIENEEKLQAAIALSKFQASVMSSSSPETEGALSEVKRIQRRFTGKFLLHAIEKTVEKRGYQKEQLRLAGYNSFDVFYCEVSRISELFANLDEEIQALVTSIGESDRNYLHALLESGCAILSMLCTPVQSSATSFALTGSWAFTREVRSVLANHISRLSVLVGFSQGATNKQLRWQHDDVFDITDQIQKLGIAMLDLYARFIPLVSSDEAEELRKEERLTKCVTLNPLVYIATQTPSYESEIALDCDQDGAITQKRANLFSQCVEFCEKYLYFEGMIFLIFVEDSVNLSKLDCVLGKLPKSPASKRLESFCKKYEGFDHFVFQWYNGEIQNPWAQSNEEVAQTTMMAYLLAHSQIFAPSLHKFMKTREHLHKYRWLTAVSLERYDQVATLSLCEAKKEQRSLSKRKTMTSIAKIAACASSNLSHSKIIQEINDELLRNKLQELLLQLPLKKPINPHPLLPKDLVHACLASALSTEKDDPMRINIFLMALEVLETIATDPITDEYKELRAGVWRTCIVDDAELWDNIAAELAAGVNEETLESLMRQTLLYQVMTEHSSQSTQGAESRAALTVEVIRELVHREGDVDSIVSVQSQQLLLKTLHLASH